MEPPRTEATTVKVMKSPLRTKKLRAVLHTPTTLHTPIVVDFGGRRDDGTPYSDYTQHKDFKRAKLYVHRHGGARAKSATTKEELRDVVHSTKETWTKQGIGTSGFWARWYLWSDPSVKKAREHMEKRFDLKFT